MLQLLLTTLDKLHPLTPGMRQQLEAISEVRQFSRHHLLLREGQVANHACFVLKGLARAYYTTDGQEITARFMNEGFMITSWLSFYTRQPGYEFIELLEDSELACLHYNDIERLYREHPEFNVVGRKLTEHYFYLAERRTQMLRKHTAYEKYAYFTTHYASLLQRVPLKHIATYLGMSEETLSRVRAKAARERQC